jgi:hypothetical protein
MPRAERAAQNSVHCDAGRNYIPAMRRGTWFAVLTLAAVGCGADVDRTKPEEVAAAWVDAVNDREWSRACELSVQLDGIDCEEVVGKSLADVRGVELEGVYTTGSGKGTAGLSAERGEALPREVELERSGDEWSVHYEVQVIR